MGDSGWGNDDWGTSDNTANQATTENSGKTGDSGWGNDDWGSSGGNDRGPKQGPRNNEDKGKPSDSWAASNNSWGSSGGNNDRGPRRSGDDRGFKRGPRNDDDQGKPADSWGSSGNNDNWSSSGGNNDNNWGSSGGNDRGPKREPRTSDSPRKRFKNEDGQNNDGNKEERPAPYKPEELDLEEEAQLQADAGENFDRYKDHKVTCIPKDILKPIDCFEDIVKSKLLLKNIAAQRYQEMTPIQKWAMPAIMEGHDLIACAQTGSGKTAAFLLPILQNLLNADLEPNNPNEDIKNPYCLIISPTRELANQIHIHANMLSKDSIIRCHVIYGQIATVHLKAKLSTGCHILVSTVGRLKDFVERGWIGFKNIKYVIMDEGDRLVDEGFSVDIKKFFEHESMPPKEQRQTLFFSATFKEETQLNARQYLKDGFVFLTVGKIGAANMDIKQEFMKVSRQEKKRELKKILLTVPEDEKTIIFTQTKQCADILAGFLSALNLSSTSIHGDRHQSQREQAIKSFRRGEKRFLISSPVGNRGLDLPKVSLVINYDLPPSIDEYVHRIGRTGRAGHTGRAMSFYDEDRDRELVPSLIEILTDAKQEIPGWLTGTEESAASGFNNEAGASEDWDSEAKPAASSGGDGWGNESKTAPTNSDDWGEEPQSKPQEPAASTEFNDEAW